MIETMSLRFVAMVGGGWDILMGSCYVELAEI